MNVPVKQLSGTAKLPVYATEGAAAADICADLLGPVFIEPGETALVGTGLAAAVPEGFVMLVYPRSGLAVKEGLTLANCVGVIDSDYRGEIKVALHNISNEQRVIEPGQRIAQVTITPAGRAVFVSADELSDTGRGDGGFGSTGRG